MIGLTNSNNYRDIANAIRSVNGSANTYKPSQMAAAIMAGSGDTDIPFMEYDAAWGEPSTSQDVSKILATNMLAYAMSENKDIIIKFKLGSSTAGGDDVFMYFYFGGDYLRLFVHHAQHKAKFQLGGGSSSWVTFDESKELEIKIDHTTHDMIFSQDGTVIDTLHWGSWSTTPLTTVAGATAIQSATDWMEYMKIYMK